MRHGTAAGGFGKMDKLIQLKSLWIAETNRTLEARATHIRRDVMQNIRRRWWSDLTSRQTFCEQLCPRSLPRSGKKSRTRCGTLA